MSWPFHAKVAIKLLKSGVDFTGGESVLSRQRPRMRSGPEVPLLRGDALIFAVHHCPAATVDVGHGGTRSGVGRTMGYAPEIGGKVHIVEPPSRAAKVQNRSCEDGMARSIYR